MAGSIRVALLCGLAGWCALKATRRLLRARRSRRAAGGARACGSSPEGLAEPHSPDGQTQATDSTRYTALPGSPPAGAAAPSPDASGSEVPEAPPSTLPAPATTAPAEPGPEPKPTSQGVQQEVQPQEGAEAPAAPPPGTGPPAALLEGLPLVPWAALEDEGVLGEGGFGAVHRCRHDGIYFAVKRAKEGVSGTGLLQEAITTARLSHRHVIQVKFIVADDQGAPCGYAMPLAACTLDTLLDNGEIREMDVVEQLRMCLDLARAVAHLHANGIAHYDLKPQNILAMPARFGSGDDPDYGYSLALADFGLAAPLAPGEQPFARQGTWPYWAPEQHTGRVSRLSESYALGLIMLEILLGDACLPAVHDCAEAHRMLVERVWRPSMPDELPMCVQSLLANCLLAPAERRTPSAAVVAELEQLLYTPQYGDDLYDDEDIDALRASGTASWAEVPVEVLV